MASTNKTPNLELPQWQLTDKLEMDDFNDAFSDIDTNVTNIEDELESHKADSVSQEFSQNPHGTPDYEEGNFTPILNTINNDMEVSYSHQVGKYIKYGNLVFIDISMNITISNNGTSFLIVDGLPFTFLNYTSRANAISLGLSTLLNSGNNHAAARNTTIRLLRDGGSVQPQDVLKSDGYLSLSGVLNL